MWNGAYFDLSFGDEMEEQIHDKFHCLALGFNIVAKLVFNCQTRQSKPNNDHLDLQQLYKYLFLTVDATCSKK